VSQPPQSPAIPPASGHAHSHAPRPLPEPTIRMSEGWHCLHLYYQVDQKELNRLDEAARTRGREELARLLDPARDGAPQRLQTSLVSGHKADLGLMIMDPNPLVIDSVRQAIRTSVLGPALVPSYSFVSITEVSEYVPTVEQYGERLQHEGASPSEPAYQAKINAYAQRLPAMNKQRLYPDFPPLPVTCFYPMNKIRHPLANWYQTPFSERSTLMAEHATSGIKFAGRVSQLITASTGFDDWEWGVTLWGRTPEDIKAIVYTMRFDRASARYAEFGPFYISYVVSPEEALTHLRV
jgi:hydrogen peroxide-dependent heme synthase